MSKAGPQGGADAVQLDVSMGAADLLRSRVSLFEVLAESLDRDAATRLPRTLLTQEQAEIFGTHAQGRASAAQYEAMVEKAHLELRVLQASMLDFAAGTERFLAAFPTDEALAGATAADVERAMKGGAPPVRP